MDAYLFSGAPPVHILPDTLTFGGSWEGGALLNGLPLAHDSDLIRRVHDHLKDIPDALLVDVGASTGSYSLLPAILPNVSACAFEPNPDAVKLLRWNVHASAIPLDRFALFPVGLSNTKGTGKLSVPTGAEGCATLGFLVGEREFKVMAVPLVRLDDMPWNRRVDFIKLDTECSELYVLQGAEATIARFRPTLLIENTQTTFQVGGYGGADVPSLLEEWGYTWDYVADGNLWAMPR